MIKKTTLLGILALAIAYSPAFAADSAAKAAEAGRPASTENAAAPKKKQKAEKPVMRKLAKEEIGRDAVCPVTGEKFKVTAETGSASYKGKVYYFCCAGCDKKFIANPGKYLDKKPAAHAKTYVCPMGDYQGDKPGKCPKCGMNLVEKK